MARELMTAKLEMRGGAAEVFLVLQELLTVRGLVSFSVDKDGLTVQYLRDLHDPPISIESLLADIDESEAIGRLEDVHTLPGVHQSTAGLLLAMNTLMAQGNIPSIVVVPSKSVLPFPFVDAADGLSYYAGLRVVESTLLDSASILVFGSATFSNKLRAARVGVRVITNVSIPSSEDTDESNT